MIEAALRIALQAHQGQTDKAGQPYILHPLRVMAACDGDLKAQMVAILHDVAEDCPDWPLVRIRAHGFPAEVMEALELLTHAKDKPYEAYVGRIKPNALARKVKLADLADNMNLGRLQDPQEKDYKRLEKYKTAQAILMA